MWTDDDIERNITSSDVEFLEGEDHKEKTTKKEVKNKPASVSASFNNARHVLTTPDLSADHLDVDMNDIMSVFDSTKTSEMELTLCTQSSGPYKCFQVKRR